MMQCKAQDAVWRAEAAYTCAYDAAIRAEQLQRQVEETQIKIDAMHAAIDSVYLMLLGEHGMKDRVGRTI